MWLVSEYHVVSKLNQYLTISTSYLPMVGGGIRETIS